MVLRWNAKIKNRIYWSFIFEINFSESFGSNFSTFSQSVWNFKNHRSDKFKWFNKFNIKMKIIWKNFVSRDFLFLKTFGITLSKIFTNDIFGLVSVFTSSTDFRKELLDFKVFSEMESIDTDLDNASIEDSLSIVITFADSFRNVAHNENFFGFFSLVDCMVENKIKNGFCDVLIDSRSEDWLNILLKGSLISKFSESKFIIWATFNFFHKVGAHKVHVFQNFEWKFNSFSVHVFLDTHVSGNFVHEVQNSYQILKSFRILNITFIDKNEWFSEFSFQNKQESLDWSVDSLFLTSGDFISAVFSKELNIFQKIIFFRFSENVVDNFNMAENGQPAVSIEMGKFHLSIDFNSDWNINKQEWEFFKIFIVFGLLNDFVQVIKIFFTLVFSGKFMERVDDIFYFSLSLLDWFNFYLLFLMNFSQMEFWLLLFLFFFLFLWYLILRFVIIFLFRIFSAACTFLILFQEIFSSDHNIFWSPITSVFIFIIRLGFGRWWFEFFFLFFSWRIGVLILKELFHFFIEFWHDFISQFLFHGIESFCGIFIKFFVTWWSISSHIIINSL